MKTIKGPALFLAQFGGDDAPFNSWNDLDKAASSIDYCDEFKGVAQANGIEVTELSSHLQGQLVAVHPAYDDAFDGFAAPEVRGNPKARQAWAVDQVGKALEASKNLGIGAHGTFSGALAWPYVYPWPQRPAGLVENAFDELAKRWRPLLDKADACGVDVCYEIHPGEDLYDGVTFEMFLERVDNHARCNMLYDPSHYVLQPWVDRAGRFRSLGDGQVDFVSIFSKLSACDFDGWAVVEWECCLKHPEDGAREGAQFVNDHIIRVTDKAFDDFADGGTDEAANRKMLGIEA